MNAQSKALASRRRSMTNERILELLQMTKTNKRLKNYYPEYLELQSMGLVTWQLGTAFLTEKGEAFIGQDIGQ